MIWLVLRPLRNATRASPRSARSACCSPRSGCCRSRRTSATRPTCGTSRSATTSTGCSCRRTGSSTRSPWSRSAPGSGTAAARRSSSSRSRVAPAWSSTLGRCCAASWARRRRGTCACCRSGTSCCSCSRRSASPSSCGSRGRSARVGRARLRARRVDAGATPRRRRGRAGRVGDPPSRRRGAAPRRAGIVDRARDRAVVAIAVLAVIATTVALVRVQDRRGFLPYWARYNYTGYESGTAEDFTAKSWPEYRAFLDTANSLAARPHAVGGRRRDRRVRHAARAHAAAVLDRRPHPVDGGPLLRGVGDDAVPLHDGRDARAVAVEPGARAAVQVDRRLRPRRAVPPADGRALLRGVQRRRRRRRRRTHPALRPVATVPDLDGKPPSGWTIYQVADSPMVAGARRTSRSSSTTSTPAPAWKCNGRGRSRSQDAGRRVRVQPVGVQRGAVVQRPDALDRPLTAGGPASWKRGRRRRRTRRGEARAARRSRCRTSARPRLGRVRRVAHRRAGDGEDVVLPELGGRRRRRAVARDPELHGGRADEQARRARPSAPRPPRGGAGAHGRGLCSGSGGAGVVGHWPSRRSDDPVLDGARGGRVRFPSRSPR